MDKRFAVIAALALVAGCGGNQPVAETNVAVSAEANAAAPAGNEAVAGNTAAAAPVFQLADDGLWVTLADGRNQRAGFAASREITVPIATTALGAPTGQGSNPECGAGPLDNVDFTGGLTLFFQDGKFVGWSIDGRDGSPYRTASGIGIGSTLQQLRDAGDVEVQSTSLGTEFTARGVSGLLTSDMPDGKVTNLWAGTTCAFR